MRPVMFGTLLSAALWTAGCSPSLTTSPSVTANSEGQETEAQAGSKAAEEGNALVRFVNADPNGKGADIIWGNEKFFSDVPYKSTTPYLKAPRGTALFKLRAPGGTTDLSAGHRELIPGRHYTLVALPQEEHGAKLAILSDSLGLLEPGEARIRLINATTAMDELDLFIAGTPNRILHGIEAERVATIAFVDMEAGDVEIRSPSQSAPTLVAKLKVEEGRLYTFIVVDAVDALDVVQIVDRTEP